MGGFSKAYAMTGWRVGYVAAPAGDPRGHGQGPPVRDHVGRRRRPRTRRSSRSVEGEADVERMRRRVRPPPPAARRRAQRARSRDVRAARRVLRLPADHLDRPRPTTTFTERLLTEERVAVVPGQRLRAVRCRPRAHVLRDLVRAARGGAASDRPVRGASPRLTGTCARLSLDGNDTHRHGPGRRPGALRGRHRHRDPLPAADGLEDVLRAAPPPMTAPRRTPTSARSASACRAPCR